MSNKKTGRPRKSPDDKRTIFLHFRLNKAENANLNLKAVRAGKEVGPFIRESLEL